MRWPSGFLARAPRELQLLQAVHEQGDSNARSQLIEDGMPLVRAMARRYGGRREQHEDLVQIGAIGLIKAIDRFDPTRGVELQSYAIAMIVGEIKRHFRDRGWAVHVPRGLKQLSLELTQLDDQLSASLGRAPTIAELAKAAGVEPHTAAEAIAAGRAYTAVSLSVPTSDDSDTMLGDTLADPKETFSAVEDRDLIARSLAFLNERERRIIELRFFDQLTQTEIARRIGVSQMQISRLLRRSLEKIPLAAA
jgi:RNA polymerase sigma-B factor